MSVCAVNKLNEIFQWWQRQVVGTYVDMRHERCLKMREGEEEVYRQINKQATKQLKYFGERESDRFLEFVRFPIIHICIFS